MGIETKFNRSSGFVWLWSIIVRNPENQVSIPTQQEYRFLRNRVRKYWFSLQQKMTIKVVMRSFTSPKYRIKRVLVKKRKDIAPKETYFFFQVEDADRRHTGEDEGEQNHNPRILRDPVANPGKKTEEGNSVKAVSPFGFLDRVIIRSRSSF